MKNKFQNPLDRILTLDSLSNCNSFSYGNEDPPRNLKWGLWDEDPYHQYKPSPYALTHVYGEWEKLYRRHWDITSYFKKGNTLEDISLLLNLNLEYLRVYCRLYHDKFRRMWIEPWIPPEMSDNLD